jgi:hypothetical protein
MTDGDVNGHIELCVSFSAKPLFPSHARPFMKLKDGWGVEGFSGENVIVIGSTKTALFCGHLRFSGISTHPASKIYKKIHKGESEEENNGDVVFKFSIHRSAGKYGGGEALLHQPLPPSHSRLLDRYLKTT